MIEISNIKLAEGNGHQWRGTEQGLLEDAGFQNIKEVYDHLEQYGYCHVKVKGGDYDGSIAKFTVDTEEDSHYTSNHDKLYYRVPKWFNVKYYWSGRLSWKGKRNNPKFTLMNSTCTVLLDYKEDELLQRFNLKAEGKKLLEQEIFDIDGNKLVKGCKVLYMNLRYGSGGKLCHGVVKAFKAHARDGYVSVIITNDSNSEESECRQPSNQIWRSDL